jgi:hypothetical protein
MIQPLRSEFIGTLRIEVGESHWLDDTPADIYDIYEVL